MVVNLFKRSNGILYVEYEVDFKRVQKSTRLLDTPQNRALIQKEVIPALQRKIARGELSKYKPKSFQYYSELYVRSKSKLKGFERVKKHVDYANRTFGTILITHITRGVVKEWIQGELERISSKTLQNYLAAVRGVLDVAVDHEVISKNVAMGIKLPTHIKKEVEPFTPLQVHTLLANATGWLKLYLAISFFTGLRTGEVLGLMQGDINLKTRVISVKRSISQGVTSTPKNAKSIREVPIFDDLVPYLKNTPKSLWLFTKLDGSPVNGLDGAKQEKWKNLLKDCNIEYRKIYATRHTFIVSMLKNSDLSILEIAQLVGHTTTQMIIQNYGKFIKGEHLDISRSLRIFTDKSTDSIA